MGAQRLQYFLHKHARSSTLVDKFPLKLSILLLENKNENKNKNCKN